MIKIRRTNSNDSDFRTLEKLLDDELWQRYPEIQHIYEAHTRIDFIETVAVILINNEPAACGCFISHGSNLVEIKRMFVRCEQRGKGLSKKVLDELEQWACELGYKTSILETGKKQPEALALYKKAGYRLTDNFGPYKDLEDSLCFSKELA